MSVSSFIHHLTSGVQYLLLTPAGNFLSVLFLRYFRLVVHIFSYVFLYRPSLISDNHSIRLQDVHVVLPTVDPLNADFTRCLRSCLEKRPGAITIITVGEEKVKQTEEAIYSVLFAPRSTVNEYPDTRICILNSPVASKRHQVALGLRKIQRETSPASRLETVVVLLDDHVWWPSKRFLPALLAPFEDPAVHFVGTNKRVQRERGNSFAESFLNFIACLYLGRHNFEIRATNAIDGGVFVVSGRTSAIRANIACREDFIEGFTNEYFFNKLGPLNPDDDNYITRFVVKEGKDIKIQFCDDARIETTLGTVGGYTKFSSQLLRWARTTWRSNTTSLFKDGQVWYRQPWCVYAVYFTMYFNFALLWDPLIVYTFLKSDYYFDNGGEIHLYQIVTLILGSKLVKLLPHFFEEPSDILLFPFYVLFAYFHSFIKLWAGLTFWDHSWGGRNLSAIKGDSDGALNQEVVVAEGLWDSISHDVSYCRPVVGEFFR